MSSLYSTKKTRKINKFSIPSYRIMDNSTEERLLLLEEFDREDLKKRVWNESKKLWRIAFPGIIARVTSFGMIVVTQLFMGHISELDLAAFGLQQSILVRFVNGILVRILLTYCAHSHKISIRNNLEPHQD